MIKIIKRDITDIDGSDDYTPSCIVNATDPCLSEGAGVSGAIHRAVDGVTPMEGERWMSRSSLEQDADPIISISTSSAILMIGYHLCEHIIQTVAPRVSDPMWHGRLRECYRNCLELACSTSTFDEPIRSIAFPMLGTGTYGLPPERADTLAYDVCSDWEDDLDVIWLVVGPHAKDADERVSNLIRYSQSLMIPAGG